MKTNSYILARRTKTKKWEGVAVWHPDTMETCLAIAEDAFSRAGFAVANCPYAGDLGVNHAEVLLCQRNYSAPAPLREIAGTVAEVRTWADLNRAREYIKNGWDLASQPEAQAAAIKAGLIAAPVESVETPPAPVLSPSPAPATVDAPAAPSPLGSNKAAQPASKSQTWALFVGTGKDFRGRVGTYGETSKLISAIQSLWGNKPAALSLVESMLAQR